MTKIRSFLTFWYTFIVGDDWTVAATIAVTLALTYWLAHNGAQVWWLLPAAVILTLGTSSRRAAMER
jgi:hypothetical protein